PGDSPIGFRLPLNSLPWARPDEQPVLEPPDPSVVFPPLPIQQLHVAGGPTPSARGRQGEIQEQLRPARGASGAGVIRTALCVEPRNGRLHVFMPPVATTEDYLDLVAAVEATAASVGVPVIVEGTPPAPDPRLNSFKITPDPGVIE